MFSISFVGIVEQNRTNIYPYMKQCSNCKTMLEDDEMFCHECGAKQNIEEEAVQEEQPAQDGVQCIHCGEIIEEDSAFCPYCGKPQLQEKKVEEQNVDIGQDQPITGQSERQPTSNQQEEIAYEAYEEKMSKAWIWILLAVLLAGAGVWYFFFNQENEPIVAEEEGIIEEIGDSIYSDEKEMVDEKPSSPLAFLEDFYKGEIGDEGYIEQNVTANVLNKLKRDNLDDDCKDCLATWVFTAYPPGSDLYLEEGPIITKSKDGDKYSIYYSYYTHGQSGRIYKPRGLLVSVTEIDGKYLISNYELVMPDIVQNQDALAKNLDGQYYLQDGHLFFHVIKDGPELEVDFNFRDGTYVSATYEFSCVMNEENKFHSEVHKLNGTLVGTIDGVIENGVIKVDININDNYRGSYELKVDK